MLGLSISRWGCLVAIPALALFSLPQTASAQSLFGGGGGATSQTGGSSFGGATGTSRTTASSGLSNRSGFSSSFGGSGQIGGATNQAVGGLQTESSLTTEVGQLSQTVGQNAFVGRSDETAGAFIGNRMAGQQQIQGTNLGGSQFGGSQFGGRGQGGFGQGGFGQGGFGGQTRRVVRHSLRVAFNHPGVETSAIQTKLNTQFQQLSTTRPELQSVQIQIGGNREAILRGQVQSLDDKKLAAMLARLEPGVRTVKNELTVEGN